MQILKSPNDHHSQWTILTTIQWATPYLKSHHIDSPRLTVEILLAHALGVERMDLYINFDRPLNSGELSIFKSVIKRRLNREPVAYITGKKEFFGLELAVSKDVLIPRPETEFLVEKALEFIPDGSPVKPMKIMDMGTGSGAVIIALSKNRPGHNYFASDISFSALVTAKANAEKFGANGIRFFAGDWFSPLRPLGCDFELIVSNPPYISSGEIPHLASEINHEPKSALDGGVDGMDAIRTLIRSSSEYLKKGAMMLLEIGYDQRDRVEREIIKSCRFELIKFVKDYGGHDRIAVIRKAK